jgi:aryl sulfotransferase
MTTDAIMPVKTRELRNHHFDSTIWNDFCFRDDDVIIATYGKAGTTWTQQIVGQLIFAGDPDVSPGEISPWVDLRVPPKDVKLPALEAQTHRRFLKTHLPVDALRFDPRVRYIYVARDGRDVIWSMYNHHANANEKWFEALNDTPGRVGEPVPRADPDIRRYFRTWLEEDGAPFWPFWENVRSWWEIRHLPNVRLLHFEDLLRDLPGEMRAIAGYLDIAVDEERWPRMVEHCTFDWMKKHASKAAPLGGAFWDGGAETFINKGTNGRWRDVLSGEECSAYEERAVAELGETCARWLHAGGPTDD